MTFSKQYDFIRENKLDIVTDEILENLKYR